MNTLTLPADLARTLSAAPHRLLFFVGAANVLAAMAWRSEERRVGKEC